MKLLSYLLLDNQPVDSVMQLWIGSTIALPLSLRSSVLLMGVTVPEVTDLCSCAACFSDEDEAGVCCDVC